MLLLQHSVNPLHTSQSSIAFVLQARARASLLSGRFTNAKHVFLSMPERRFAITGEECHLEHMENFIRRAAMLISSRSHASDECCLGSLKAVKEAVLQSPEKALKIIRPATMSSSRKDD